MEKNGYLYMNNGRYGKKQILLPDWIKESIKIHINLPDSESYGLSDYGFQWLIHSVNGHSAYFAWRWGGQPIYVVSDLSLRVVTTSNAGFDSVVPHA
jgi:hypothetical protein